MADKITIGGKNYVLTFEDNFDGTALDTTKWELCPEQPRQDLRAYWRDELTEVKDGNLILDSIASNACAHFLHNMLFLLGETMETSGEVAQFRAECFRANEIENFDTCCIKMKSSQGADLYFLASHAAGKKRSPIFRYTFEKGEVLFDQEKDAQIVARFHDGRVKVYGNPFEDDFKKLRDCVAAAKAGTKPVCTVGTATPHVKLIEGIYTTTPVHNFPESRICVDEETDTVSVQGLFEAMYLCYDKGMLFSELESPVFGVF